MNYMKDYYSNCIHACTPEKYVIDQSEIEFSNTRKTNLSFKILDLYYSTAGSFNIHDNRLFNFETRINNNVKLVEKQRNERNCTNVGSIKILENFFLNSERNKSHGANEMCKERRNEKLRYNHKKEGHNKKGINKGECIFIENAFHSVITAEEETISHKTFLLEKKITLKKKKEKYTKKNDEKVIKMDVPAKRELTVRK
ncbi:conserved Plasmodium protein, unknown function [Plasmodium ovale wallikeri]|uniref:Uncharacterized protein n=2 Tax=Plasmodium ovale TaxID=36330 RepID=A0A1A8Z297_PLAOA|nr:conserved Plasmodium protein, unknown function [Plasmodium ovale wallikeri]SBT37882.1 conserved Plasmodium protein, unknown function [Plasmodium ovale wallikeri]SBT77561.1 conserved Plasmodium protein, unknown function [Plasmodium ovale]